MRKGQSSMHPVHCVHNSGTNGAKTSNWTPKEDNALRDAVDIHKARNWKSIAECLPNRTDIQCLHRWQKVLNPILVKGYWTKEEDDRVIELVEMFGVKRWAAIARCLPGRNGKQCRERWCNHLDPQIRRDAWTDSEDMMLFLAHKNFGNKWAEIAKLLPGRSDNGIKNRWNTAVKKNAKELQECCIRFDEQKSVPHDGTSDNLIGGRPDQSCQDQHCIIAMSEFCSKEGISGDPPPLPSVQQIDCLPPSATFVTNKIQPTIGPRIP